MSRRRWYTSRRTVWPTSVELDADAPIDLLPVTLAPAALVDAELADWRDHANRITGDACLCRTCRVLDDVPALEDALWQSLLRDLRSTR